MAAHARGGMYETRERSHSEQRATDASKNIGVFCGYALVAGLSRGYTCICGQGVAHAAVTVGFAARCEKGIALWWPEGLISFG